jgi:hypothetical protein
VFKDVFEVLPKLRLEMLRRIIRLARSLALVKLSKLLSKEKEKEKPRIFEEVAGIFAPFLLRPKEGQGYILILIKLFHYLSPLIYLFFFHCCI